MAWSALLPKPALELIELMNPPEGKFDIAKNLRYNYKSIEKNRITS